MFTLRELLEEMVKLNASDLHLTVGSPPVVRVDGRLQRLNYDVLTSEQTKKLCYSMLTEKQKLKFEQNSELDFSFGIEQMSRFRCNVFMQRGNIAVVLRQIPYKIRTFDELGLPKVIAEFAKLPRGLVLVTGPTGSGKSTTLAAIIDKINRERPVHIITVEDPIEYLHRHQAALVNQREVYSDTTSFATALKYALREDPDVVLVGEMRDLETIEAALSISETGHLAFATLHTNSASESINRIVDSFPTNQQEQVRVSLSFSLQAIVSQALIPKIGGGRVMALEIMVCTPAIRALVRDDKVHQMYSMIQSGQKYGMKTMNQSLSELYLTGKITLNDAMSYSSNTQELGEMLSRQKSPAFS
ncbi:MAG TPA: type IV pilus twitching motility protein PilT [candidate division Zixibacteria bacterium]|nr:type IV pilus twitching motility protein PilT [candidate division Zixibacteria bacterium]MDD4917096.1 type IV pilus twitching motility protein PilT [candidate division Zixibacteria bacterium]MDM7972720.1 type IV pilus twitching motility protein PilT [candidate division Zixibacteria bacterium]HOD65322.1 type IV pilus twitching motility protein PilT [candidate division Zixibacteria bacterium]HOZ08062.1 type IV pilus twitching motility protein PilT [candidate division Zixibacteria bacterium]